jgi:hypothetical protein
LVVANRRIPTPLTFTGSLGRHLSSIPNGSGRSAFWRTAFAAYRDARALSQKLAALDKAAELATPEALDGSPRSREASPTIVAGLVDAFGLAVTDDILYKSGSIVGVGGLPRLERLAYDWRRVSAALAAAAGVRGTREDCNCAYAGTCAGDEYCNQSSGCTVVPQPNNCEIFFLLDCTGMCRKITF